MEFTYISAGTCARNKHTSESTASQAEMRAWGELQPGGETAGVGQSAVLYGRVREGLLGDRRLRTPCWQLCG